MIRGLLVGVLTRDPEKKAAANGTSYTKAMLRVESKVLREGDPDSLMVWITAFGDTADALALKKKGDSVAVAGRLDIRASVYQDKPSASVSVTCDKLIDATRLPRKPKDETAVSAKSSSTSLPDVGGAGVESMSSDVPF